MTIRSDELSPEELDVLRAALRKYCDLMQDVVALMDKYDERSALPNERARIASGLLTQSGATIPTKWGPPRGS